MISEALQLLLTHVMSAVDVMHWHVPVALMLVYAIPFFVLAGAGRPRKLAALATLTLGATVLREWGDSLPYSMLFSSPLQAISIYIALVLLLLTRSPVAMAGPLVGWALGFAAPWLARWFRILVLGPETDAMIMDPWLGRVEEFFFQLLSLIFWHGATALGLFIWMRTRRRGLSASPVCSRCRYPLTGLTNLPACPECGAGFGSSPRSGAGT